MNRITKDTPLETRVLVSSTLFGLYRSVLIAPGRTVQTATGLELQTVWVNPPPGFAAPDEIEEHVSNVYLDEPAVGSFNWACAMALKNQPTVRDRGRVKLELVNDTLRLFVRYQDGWDYVDFGRDDLTAIDWEITK